MRDSIIKAAVAAAIAVCVAGTASAQGVRLSGSASQSVQFRDNANFRNNGFSYTGTSNLSFRLSSETQTTQIYAGSGLSFRFDDQGNTRVSPPSLRLGFSTGTQTTTLNGTLTYSEREISYDEVQPDLSILTLNGDRINGRATLGLNHQVNSTTRVSLGANVSLLDFDPSSPALVASNTYGVTGGINYQLNSRTSLGVNGGLSFFEADNAANTESTTTSLNGTVSHAINRTLNFNANIGASFVETTASGVTTDTARYLFGASLTQQLPDGSINLGINQNILPAAAGNLVVNTGLRAGWNKQINQSESIGLSANLDLQENVNGTGQQTFFGISPRYNVQLTRDVSANAAYTLQRDDAGNFSQGLTFSISRNFDLPF